MKLFDVAQISGMNFRAESLPVPTGYLLLVRLGGSAFYEKEGAGGQVMATPTRLSVRSTFAAKHPEVGSESAIICHRNRIQHLRS